MNKTLFQKTNHFFRIIICSIFFQMAITGFSYADVIELDAKQKRLIANSHGSYQWFFEGTKIEGATEKFLCIEKTGSYSLHSIDAEGHHLKESVYIIVEGNVIRKIYLIGDSTVTNYRESDYPMMGWGQVFQHFFDKSAFVIDNRAIGGRSSRSFIEEGRWDEVRSVLKADDYVLIQFGHNDRDWTKAERYTSPADYKVYLKQYVNEARAKGAIPVLVSPMVMNAWRDDVLRNVFTETNNDYRGAMLEVANELNVPFVDLNMKSYELVASWGYENARRFLYNYYLPGEYLNYPNGSNDGLTHFQEMAAIEMAKFVAEGIEELKEDERIEPLAHKLLPLYPLTIKVNDPTAGVITRSQSYPAGVTITLKTLPETGHTFLFWKKADGTTISSKTLTSVTKAPKEEIIYAFYDEETPTDCAGEFNGSAKLDNCGICSGGTTEKEACTAAFQMEDACVMDGSVKTGNSGYQGTGYFASEAAEGAAVEWVFNSSSANEVTLTFRYANGGETTLDGLLTLNENEIGQVSFPATNSWSNWSTSSTTVTLQEGSNHFNLAALSARGLANLDLIAYNVTTIEAGDCDPGLTYLPLDQAQENFRVYPNPFSDNLIIEGASGFYYKIYDVSGRLQTKGYCQGNCTLNTPAAQGLYQLIIETTKGSYSSKIIKK